MQGIVSMSDPGNRTHNKKGCQQPTKKDSVQWLLLKMDGG